MNKHTPAPWRTIGSLVISHEANEPDTICSMVVNELGKETREANQTLIAAAPELLEALEWLVFLKDSRPSDYEEQKPLAWGCARAAIKKAKGE